MSLESLEKDSQTSADSARDISERDVKEIIESIKEAQYFDASSMAPLTPASVVRTHQAHFHIDTSTVQFLTGILGSYCTIEGIQAPSIYNMG